MKTKKEIEKKIKELSEGQTAKEMRNSPRRINKVMALEWVLENVSDI